MNDAQQQFDFFIDSPNEAISATRFLLAGWVAAQPGCKLRSPSLVSNTGARIPLSERVRPDVERAFPGKNVIGFHQELPTAELPMGATWSVELLLDGVAHRFSVSLEQTAAVMERKRKKLARIRLLLRCASCQNALIDEADTLACVACSQTYRRTAEHFDFLDESMKQLGGVRDTGNVSENPYDDDAQRLITSLRDGLILDAGAGFRKRYLDNVVNFEIVGYPSTDVLGIGERLPFKSNAFDAVFSFAVLEHVRDPFTCANELVRVLKPGGKLYAVVPFLQPFHGYPDHYYNMTSSGLRNLFGDRVRVERTGVPKYGTPIWALNWILKAYADGLQGGMRERFEQMRVVDLMGDVHGYMARDFVQALPEATNEQLACVNFLIGEKVGEKVGDHK